MKHNMEHNMKHNMEPQTVIKTPKNVLKMALLIGINYENTKIKLRGCINDCENIRTFLLKNKYMNENEIIMMTDRQQEQKEKEKEKEKENELYPTKKNIYIQLMKLIKFAHKNRDQEIFLFMSYSGHGAHVPDTNYDEEDGFDEVLCPVDCMINGYFTDDELKKIFINQLPSNVKLLFLVDACHSGTVLDLKYNYKADKSRTYSVYGKYDDTQCDVIMISGSHDSQTSSDAVLFDEYEEGFSYQGAMTASFIKHYEAGISYYKLIKCMRNWLQIKKFEQIPQLSSGKFINISDPFLLTYLE